MNGPAEELRQKRIEAGLSQVELSDRLGVNQPEVSRWENGEHVPQMRFRRRLSSEIGLPTSVWN